jgi:hypothetical protein
VAPVGGADVQGDLSKRTCKCRDGRHITNRKKAGLSRRLEFAAQGALVVAPVQSWVLAAIPLEPVGFQSRHGVRHHLVMPE